MTIVCKKCGSVNTFDVRGEKRNYIGAYCKNCGCWIKWLSKKELSELSYDDSLNNKLIIEDVIDDINENKRVTYIDVDEENINTEDLFKKYKELQAKLQMIEEKEKLKTTEKSIEHNKKYIGKMYKKQYIYNDSEYIEYFKILNIDTDHEDQLIALSFKLPINNTSFDKCCEIYISSFEFLSDTHNVNSIKYKCVEEISEYEYKKACKELTNYLNDYIN